MTCDSFLELEVEVGLAVCEVSSLLDHFDGGISSLEKLWKVP